MSRLPSLRSQRRRTLSRTISNSPPRSRTPPNRSRTSPAHLHNFHLRRISIDSINVERWVASNARTITLRVRRVDLTRWKRELDSGEEIIPSFHGIFQFARCSSAADYWRYRQTERIKFGELSTSTSSISDARSARSSDRARGNCYRNALRIEGSNQFRFWRVCKRIEKYEMMKIKSRRFESTFFIFFFYVIQTDGPIRELVLQKFPGDEFSHWTIGCVSNHVESVRTVCVETSVYI